MEQEKHRSVKEGKLIRAISKWMFRIAGVILCINVICRLVDAEKSTEYVQVMGTVTMVQESSEWVRAGNRTVMSSSYGVWIEYQPQGYLNEQIITEDYLDDMLSEGDVVPVLYRKDAVYKAYVAKKDWMTGAYLPLTRDYNMPLFISVIMFVVGFLFIPIHRYYSGMQMQEDLQKRKRKTHKMRGKYL